MKLADVLRASYVNDLVHRTCGNEPVVVERPAAFILRPETENARDIRRVLVLPPSGYMGNTRSQTNCFADVDRATIEVKGAVRPGKHSWSRVKHCLLVVAFNDAARVSELDRPYLPFDLSNLAPGFETVVHSAGEPPFHVVRPDGTGIYHTLLNQSDEWLVLGLHKSLRPQRGPDLDARLTAVPDDTADILRAFHEGIVSYGDDLFEQQPDLVAAVADLPPAHSIPALIDMLFVRDTGRHETCTAFATILKIGKVHPAITVAHLAAAKDDDVVPVYHADQLMAKIQRAQALEEGRPGAAMRL